MKMTLEECHRWHRVFYGLCQEGDVHKIKLWMEKTSTAWKEGGLKRLTGLVEACMLGHENAVKFLLTDPLFRDHPLNWHDQDELAFKNACMAGHVELAKYLLTSPELKEAGHSRVLLNPNRFYLLFARVDLDLLKYIIASPEMKNAGYPEIDIHDKEDIMFKALCLSQRWDAVRWLVMDYGIIKTHNIEKIIEKHPQAQEYFRAREELKEIQKTMDFQKNKNATNNDGTVVKNKRAKKL